MSTVKPLSTKASACKPGIAEIRSLLDILQFSSDAIVVIDESGTIVATNPGVETVFGYDREQMQGMNIRSLSSERLFNVPAMPEGGRQDMGLLQETNRGEIIARHRSGREFPASFSLCRYLHEDRHFLLFLFRDISEQLAMEKRLIHEATHDPLTGLPNRQMFMSMLDKAIERVHRHDSKLALLFIDLNQFKPVNDRYGHLFGDQCLKEVAGRLQRSVRSTDTVSRIGGDEFVILLEDISDDVQAADVVEKIRGFLQRPVRNGHDTVHVSASIGVKIYPDASIERDATALLHLADRAMYAEKHAFSSGMAGIAVKQTAEHRHS